ncbi:MAG: hypothetical protein WA134_02785 [Rhodoferax sp.]|uniref:hypothetical protein n=1 Tax=Rhodoferax sp. TaxID=50421 RepID=UPI003BB4D709
MSRLIAFVFCIAFLFLAGGGVKIGMVLMALVFALLVAFVAYLLVRLFLGPPCS